MDQGLLDKVKQWKDLASAFFLLPAWVLTPYTHSFFVAINCIPHQEKPIQSTDILYWYIFGAWVLLFASLWFFSWWVVGFFKKIRQVRCLNEKPCSIAMLLSCDDDVIKVRDKLYKKIEEHIYRNGFKDIVVCNFEKNKEILEKFTTREDASKYKKESQASLVIIARLESGNTSGNLRYAMKSIHMALDTRILPNMNIFKSLKFHIQDTETLEDIEIVGTNLYFISNILLSLGFLCSNRFDLADKLITDLRDQIYQLKSHKDYCKVHTIILNIFARVKDAVFSEEYKKIIKPNITISDPAINEIVEKQITTIDSYSKDGVISFNGLVIKAILLFHFGKIKDSKQVLREAQKTFEKAEQLSASCSLSLAFLEMWGTLYKLAVRRYKKCMDVPFETAQSIIEFNEYVIKNNPHRTDLYFIIAVMRKFEYAQYEHSDWNKFIASNNETEENKCLFELAKERISLLGRTKTPQIEQNVFEQIEEPCEN